MINQSLFQALGTPIHRAYFIMGIIGSLFTFFISFTLLRKYFQKKTTLRLKAGITIFIFGAALIIDPIFLSLRAMEVGDWVGLQSNISFGLLAIGNIGLLMFIREVFYKNEYNWKVYLIIGIEISILPLVLILHYQGIDTIYVLFIHLLASFTIYISQFYQSIQLGRKMRIEAPENVEGLTAIRYIGLSGIFLLLTYVSFIMQELVFLLRDVYEKLNIIQEGATIFIPLGFFLAGLSAYLLYVGLILPKWLRSYLRKRTDKENL